MGGSGSGSAGAPRVLQDVVALVMCQDPVANAKAAVTARIEGHGGRVVARLGKDVSHIVWERTRSRRPSDKAADEAQLLGLFHKLEKLEYPPVVVSPLWVEESIKAGRRLVERKYLVKKPTESLLGRTPGSAGAAAAAAKKRKRPAAVLPKPADAFEVDDGDFSSTQQMASDGPGSNNAAKQQRRGDGGGGKQAGRGGKGAAAMPAVVEAEEGEEEGSWQVDEAAPVRQQQHKEAPGRTGAVGSDTQAVANILTVDLPDCEPGRTPGISGGAAGEEEEDELDTPLALRFAKNSAERAAAWDSGGSGRGSEERRGAGAPRGGDRRSRLALASGPDEGRQGEAAGGSSAEQQDPEGMHVDEPAAAEGQRAQEEQQSVKAAAAAKGVAARFSIRQLVRHPERPVVVHKGTPLPGSVPSSPTEDKPAGDPIPIPQVERVTSPWTLAEQMPTQSQSQAPASAPPIGRPSVGQPASRPCGRRSLLGVSNMRRAGPAGGSAGATPVSARQGPQAEEPASAEAGPAKLPTPWSTLRPWDGKSARQEGDAEVAWGAGADENHAGPPQRQQQDVQAQPAPEGRRQQASRAPSATEGASSGGGSRRQRQAQSAAAAVSSAAAAAGTAASAGAGPTHGCIALTSVDAAVVDLARSATRRLRGLRLCPEGKEDGQVTHLVLGDERRTLKLMLAVANGAWLLSPQWVTASLEAGRWLPESQFSAKVRFQAAAERARCLLESPDAAPLLAEHSIYVHLPDKARKLMGANAVALRRVAAVLGAKAAQPRSCMLCIVVGGGPRPPTIPAEAACVKEEWLLLAAESFEIPPLEEFSID